HSYDRKHAITSPSRNRAHRWLPLLDGGQPQQLRRRPYRGTTRTGRCRGTRTERALVYRLHLLVLNERRGWASSLQCRRVNRYRHPPASRKEPWHPSIDHSPPLSSPSTLPTSWRRCGPRKATAEAEDRGAPWPNPGASAQPWS